MMRHPSRLLLGVVFAAALSAHGAVSQARISERSAEKVAKSAQPGTLIHKELKQDRGEWTYIFSIRGEDRKIHQVRVDARTGKIVRQDQSKFEAWGRAGG